MGFFRRKPLTREEAAAHSSLPSYGAFALLEEEKIEETVEALRKIQRLPLRNGLVGRNP